MGLDIEKVALTDVLASPTKTRDESTEESSSAAQINDDDFDFSGGPEVSDDDTLDGHLKSDPKKEPEPEPEPEEEFDPEESAESTIDIMDVGCQSILFPVAVKVLKKRYGGGAKIKKMKAVFKKSKGSKELSDADQIMINQYTAYLEKLEELREEMPFSEHEIAQLKPSTMKFCRKHGLKVNENLAFGVSVVKVLSNRIVDIVMM